MMMKNKMELTNNNVEKNLTIQMKLGSEFRISHSSALYNTTVCLYSMLQMTSGDKRGWSP